jgi:hypothetical protein
MKLQGLAHGRGRHGERAWSATTNAAPIIGGCKRGHMIIEAMRVLPCRTCAVGLRKAAEGGSGWDDGCPPAGCRWIASCPHAAKNCRSQSYSRWRQSHARNVLTGHCFSRRSLSTGDPMNDLRVTIGH